MMRVPPRLKHPEWVMMFRQGVTVEQIARLNDVAVPRVRDYVGRIRRQFPELLEGRLFLHDQPAPRPQWLPDPDRRWAAMLTAYADFLTEQGARPRRMAGEDEFRLAHWLTRQRSLERNGRLALHRARRLDEAIPDWRISDRTLGAR